MKKLISLILAVVMIFSVTAMAVSAADEATKPVKVTFIYDKADIKGIPVPETKVIYVDYGENYTKDAPKSTYIAAGWKYEIVGWTTTDVGPADRVWVNLPTIAEGDGVKEITVGWNVYGGMDKKVTAYALNGLKLEPLMQESYSSFMCCDMVGDGRKELFIIYHDNAP